MKTFKALYIEDDHDLHKLIQANLPDSLSCDMVTNLADGINCLNKNEYHLILVDLHLVGETGFEVINYLKEKEYAFIPSIIIVTASTNEDDEIKCHEVDVLEYIHKPIRPKVLKAQLEKYLRRFKEPRAMRKIGSLCIDENKMEVRTSDDNILLTLKEYKLLLKLIEIPLKTFSREELLTDVWNASSEIQSRTVDMHISSLRKKLGRNGDAISSIRGVGYSFDPHKIEQRLDG